MSKAMDNRNKILEDALFDMFLQYCGVGQTTSDGRQMFDHCCMSAGENAADILRIYGRITLDQLVR